MAVEQVVISGTGLFTPAEAISNDELVASFNTYVDHFNTENLKDIQAGRIEALLPSSAEFIVKASGIKNRYVVNKSGILDPELMRPQLPVRLDDEPSLQVEMASAAAQQALHNAGCQPEDVDMVLMACSNFERPYPAMAIELQAALGCKGFAMDINVACASATFGYQTAFNAIKSGAIRRALVVNPEICSAHLNFRDRDSHFIFGDACTATVLEAGKTCQADTQFEIIDCRLITSYSNNIRNNMGFLWRTAPQCVERVQANDKLFVQRGRKVFKEVTPIVANIIVSHLQDFGFSPQELQRLWLHQANLNMNQLIGEKILGRAATSTEAPVILDEYANTSSAGSIIAFHKHHQGLERGDLGIICAFGAGYSAGNVIVRQL